MSDLSVIIINYNTKKMTEELIDSILDLSIALRYEIVVVDNSSFESEKIDNRFGSKKNIKIVFTKNNGFGAACNEGAKVATGKKLLFINSDIVFEGDVFSTCVSYMNSNTDIGILGCKLVLKNGELDHGCKRGFPTPLASFCYYLKLDKIFRGSKKCGAYKLSYLSDEEINEVDAVSGAFLMIKKNLFDEIGGFDETFFMYGEDLDLCFRVKQQGMKIVYFPKAVVTHLKGQSGLNTKSKVVLYHFYNAMIIFYDKHYKPRYNWFLTRIIHFTIWSKYLFDLLVLRLKR